MHNIKNGTSHLTLFYDNKDQRISLVMDLTDIQCVEADDRDLTEKDLDIIDYKNKFRLWREPGFFKLLILKIKWKLTDSKKKKNVTR